MHTSVRVLSLLYFSPPSVQDAAKEKPQCYNGAGGAAVVFSLELSNSVRIPVSGSGLNQIDFPRTEAGVLTLLSVCVTLRLSVQPTSVLFFGCLLIFFPTAFRSLRVLVFFFSLAPLAFAVFATLALISLASRVCIHEVT